MTNEELSTIDPAQHERLCAYVFGELQGEGRAAFEGELARSSALRQEQERLLATIGLVKRVVPDEGLSADTRRELLASARRSRFRLLPKRRLLQLAAVCVGVLGGALAFRAWYPGRGLELQVREGAQLAKARFKGSAQAPAAGMEAKLAETPGPNYQQPGDALGEVAANLELGVADSAAIPAAEVPLLDALGYGGGSPEEPTAGFPTAMVVGLGSGKGGGNSGAGAPTASVPGRAGRAMRATPAAPAQMDSLEQGVLRSLGYVGDDKLVAERALELDRDERSAFDDGAGIRGGAEASVGRAETLLRTCLIEPGEPPQAMFFRYFGDAPFTLTLEERLSTFAADVDTASYALARAYLSQGELPPREAVRTEEFVNYFKADQPAPGDGKPFAIGLELAPSLFGGDARAELLRVTVRGKDVQDFERQPLRLTLVIDNSGSMEQGGRLELVKRALALLLRQLYAADSVALVKFSNEAALVTPMTPATRRGELESRIGALRTESGTNVEAGLRLGYEQALAKLERDAVNRVVLCSDGVGNIGETDAQRLLALVSEARKKGIYLNTVGVGMGNHDDAFLEQLADEGDGVANYVDSDAEAKRVFVDQLASAVQPIARDVKIQVEFQPSEVESWRLLGYENRALRTQDFRNDAIDAGEVNAGHQVSALYELVRRPSRGGALATVRVRYKPPFAIDQGQEGARARAEAEQALELERTLPGSALLPGFAAASSGYQRAVLVAQFAEVLRRSVHARSDDFAALLSEARRLERTLGDPDFTEFVALLEKANPLLDALAKQTKPRVEALLDELARKTYELALTQRRRDLAAQAKEPAPSEEEQRSAVQHEAELRAELQRLEAEVRAWAEK
jgi:Ca-activated chloride channel family protein